MKWKWFQAGAAAGLVMLSVVTYLVHYWIFDDARNIFFYMIMDIGFLPIQVLLVTMVINQLIAYREKKAARDKLNMVLGVFFGEVGSEFLKRLSALDPRAEAMRGELTAAHMMPPEAFKAASRRIRAREYTVDARGADLAGLKDLLAARREPLMRLIENPLLMEHEAFTDCLLAVLHLAEELDHRESFAALPDTDLRHLEGDMNRAYGAAVVQWMDYMTHLRESYPYLFSLAFRMNPFDRTASAVVTR